MTGGTHWAERAEIGTALGLRFLFEVGRRFGSLPFRAVLLPVALYFLATRASMRAASRLYLERLHAFAGSPGKPSLLLVYRHFLALGQTILEKILAWDPKAPEPRITRHGREPIARLLEQGKGLLLIGSHLGNLEVARFLATSRRHARINVLVHTRHSARYTALMRRLNPESQVSLFQVSEITPATAILLKEKVDAGEVVLIAGDRVPLQGGAIAWAPFLGHPAPWPTGPYVLASLLECPVFLFFCLGGNGSYDSYYEAFADRIVLDRSRRREQLEALAGRFAGRLSYYCTLAPLLWGNVYDFWELPESVKTASGKT